jgi:hypothetical protein
MVPDTGGRRIDRRLLQACLLALGVLVFVLVVQEIQHHRRIARWRQLGLSIHHDTAYLSHDRRSFSGSVDVDPVLPTSVLKHLPDWVSATWLVRPGSLWVRAADAEQTSEILSLADGANLRAVSLDLPSLEDEHLAQIARWRSLKSVRLITRQLDERIAPLASLPNLTRLRFKARRITPAGLKALGEFPSTVELNFHAGYIPEAVTVRRIQQLRAARQLKVDGAWRFRYE